MWNIVIWIAGCEKTRRRLYALSVGPTGSRRSSKPVPKVQEKFPLAGDSQWSCWSLTLAPLFLGPWVRGIRNVAWLLAELFDEEKQSRLRWRVGLNIKNWLRLACGSPQLILPFREASAVLTLRGFHGSDGKNQSNQKWQNPSSCTIPWTYVDLPFFKHAHEGRSPHHYPRGRPPVRKGLARTVSGIFSLTLNASIQKHQFWWLQTVTYRDYTFLNNHAFSAGKIQNIGISYIFRW
jgi:hypothetical protein